MAERIGLEGAVFGRWTVLGEQQFTPRGERKLLCRCACGVERFVLERSLLSGGSLSCGCLRKDRAAEALSHDLTGCTFGHLTALRRAAEDPRPGVRWRCRCDCGNEVTVLATILATGRRTHCGCRAAYRSADIAGRKFGLLTAIAPTPRRDSRGSVIWRCRCDCGNETEASYNMLRHTGLQSCGCLRRKHDAQLSTLLTHVDGASIDHLRSTKLPANNTTGVKGVYRKGNVFFAKIVFQKRQYCLGTYSTLAEAAAARQVAEDALRQIILPYFDRWNRAARRHPEWAAHHPIKIHVRRDAQGRLVPVILPTERDIPKT